MAGQVFSGHPNPVLTKSYQWRYDGDQKWSKEHVDIAVEERHLPCARVPQTQHVGVSVVHINVVEFSELGRKGCAYLEAETKGHRVPWTQQNVPNPRHSRAPSSAPTAGDALHLSSTVTRDSPHTASHVLGVALHGV